MANDPMTRKTRALVLLLAIGCAAGHIGGAAAQIIHEERSLYRNILVTRDHTLVCLKFTVRSDQRNQSCIDTRSPRRMVFSYTRMMLASLLFIDPPADILVVGLGGGTLPTALRDLYPDSHIDAVEIDPAVVAIASRYFGFRTDPALQLHVQDARVFTRRARTRDRRYDLVLLDAFNGDYIPEHLMTVEYLRETRALMKPDGVLAANTFSISQLYDHESATYRAAFGPFLNFRLPESANRVILARPAGYPDTNTLDERARRLAPRLKPYGVPIRRYPTRFDSTTDWPADTRPLTDDYSPANLLAN